jgi:tetratricopeptide (TPR) repeat protein
MSASGYNVDGVRNFQQGQHQTAIQKFQQALAADPGNSDSYYNLAATLHDWGRRAGDASLLQQAEGLYHQCLDINPDHVDCHRGLAVLLVDTKRPQSAFTLLERWVARSRVSDARVELARLHEEFGDGDAARRYLADALEVDATNPRAWSAMGRLREQEGQYAQALANYRHAYNLNNFQPGVQQRITQLQRLVARSNTLPTEPQTAGRPSRWVPR